MQVGFAIDHRKCIGCHACTVACKAENDVPLGRFRTWVKYVEKGTFPTARRHFTVLRCNHCDRAPCVTICPVNALHKRPDAIVDLDRDVCIGCRACMQACPYDALYFDTDRGVAEKCHYCAHRVERGLEPACVIVCPAEAIISGDASDPSSRLARLVASEPTERRKVDKGTEPRVWYVGALEEALVPGTAAKPVSWLWAERPGTPVPGDATPRDGNSTVDLWTTLDVEHPPTWGWHVWVYLVTKNIAAGAAIVAPFLAWLGVRDGWARRFVPEVVTLGFVLVTVFLLVHDLGRPERVWRLLLRPNPRSWLVKGAWVLTGFGAVVATALGARWAGHEVAADAARWLALPLAVLTSGYSAWLFGQCRGRDLWFERGVLRRLVGRAILCGAGLAALLPHDAGAPSSASVLFALLAAAAALAVWHELQAEPVHPDTARAQAILVRRLGRLRVPMLFAAASAFATLPIVLAGAAPAAFGRGATLLAVGVAGWALMWLEAAWIRSGQEVPLS